MAKRRKGKGKHYKKDVKEIHEDSNEKPKSKSDRRRERRARKDKKLSKVDRRAKKRKDDIVFFSVLIIIVASIFGAYFAYDIYFKDNFDDDEENNYQPNGGTKIPDVGDQAPDFTLMDTDGIEFSLYEYLGDLVILDFMADYCLPCHDQMLPLNEIYMEYNHLGVSILSIGISDNEDYVRIRDNVKLAYDCQWRFAAYGGQVAENYGVMQIPNIFILDQDGIIVHHNVGVSDGNSLRAVLVDLL
jgi:peroxiredoxin